jgi:hypothetical protein
VSRRTAFWLVLTVVGPIRVAVVISPSIAGNRDDDG